LSFKKKPPASPDVNRAIKRGVKHGNNCFAVFAVPCSDTNSAKTRLFTATISKKFIKKSVDRNLLKRRVRGIFAKNSAVFEGKDVVVMARSGASGLKTFKETEENLLSLFKLYGKTK